MFSEDLSIASQHAKNFRSKSFFCSKFQLKLEWKYSNPGSRLMFAECSSSVQLISVWIRTWSEHSPFPRIFIGHSPNIRWLTNMCYALTLLEYSTRMLVEHSENISGLSRKKWKQIKQIKIQHNFRNSALFNKPDMKLLKPLRRLFSLARYFLLKPWQDFISIKFLR